VTDLSRRDRIVLLAGSLEDYLPGPWMGRSEWSAEGPSERRECRRCQGEGRVRTRKGIEPCEACGSRGVVVVDAYTGRVVAKVREDEFALHDGEITETLRAEKADYEARRRRQERVDHLLGDDREGEDWVDWVIRRKRALYRVGDYARLERQLGELTAMGPGGTHLAAAFMAVYGPGAADRRAGELLRISAAEALDWLEGVMPRVPRVPSWLLGARNRDEEILHLSRQRMPQPSIAARLGISVATVSRVLARLTAV
jgi:hypothetical protein